MHIPKAICAQCKHCHINKRPNHIEPIWYDIFCQAVENERGIDPVTGKQCFIRTNSLGTRVFVQERFPNCSEINADGNCSLFERK